MSNILIHLRCSNLLIVRIFYISSETVKSLESLEHYFVGIEGPNTLSHFRCSKVLIARMSQSVRIEGLNIISHFRCSYLLSECSEVVEKV